MEAVKTTSTLWWKHGAPALVVRLSRAAGVAPLVFQPHGVDISPALVLYGALLMIAIQVFGIWSTVVMNMPSSGWIKLYGKTTNTTWLIQRCILLITNFIGAFFSSYRMKKWIGLVERVVMMKTKLGDEIYSNAVQKTELKVIVISLLLLIVMSGFDFVTYAHILKEGHSDAFTTILTLVPYYILYLVQTLLEMQLLLTFWYIISLLPGVTQALKRLLRNAESDGEQSAVVIGCKATEGFPNRKPLTGNDINSIYIEICELVDIMNEGNGSVMFFILLNCIIHLTVFPYNVIDNVMSQITLPLLFVDLSWCIFHLVHIYIFIAPGHCLVKESHQIRVLVGKLLAKEWNVDVAAGLKKLYKTLLLNNPTFSPLSMCVISRELIVSIFGIALTYLVILIQFETSEKIKNKE